MLASKARSFLFDYFMGIKSRVALCRVISDEFVVKVGGGGGQKQIILLYF